jgi:hypothetical protein
LLVCLSYINADKTHHRNKRFFSSSRLLKKENEETAAEEAATLVSTDKLAPVAGHSSSVLIIEHSLDIPSLTQK